MLTYNATYHNQPIDVLNKLIEKRIKWLGTESKNACVAAAIDVAKSLRADTRKAVYRKKITIKPTNLFAFWDFRKREWCATTNWQDRIGGRVELKKIKYLNFKNTKSKNLRLFQVLDETGEHYFVGANNLRGVEEVVRAAAKKRIARMGGLAKNALTVVTGKLAAKAPRDKKLGEEVSKTVSKLAQVKEVDQKNGYSVWFTSGINYGKLALKNPPSLAVKKAANKIAGMLKKFCASKPFYEKIPTPFPEVRKRK